MSDLQPRRAEPDELATYTAAVNRHFHEDESPETLRPYLEAFAADYRAWIVRDASRIVGNLGVIESDLSVPGGVRLPVAAVTAVGVAQTSRRRGLLRSLMTAALDEAVAHDEPVAALFASESPIYTRFGFGLAAPSIAYRVLRSHIRFRDPVDVRLVETVDVEHARAAWPAIHDAMRVQRPGSVGTTPGLWQLRVGEDLPDWRAGASTRRLVEVPGRGYASYRIKGGDEDGLPDGEVVLLELVATDPEAESALWQHVCDVDLTATLRAELRPPDDALALLVGEPMALGIRQGPPLWVRILDVARCLGARRYPVADSVVLDVRDPLGYAAGRIRLHVDGGAGHAEPSSDEPDVTLDVEALAGLWLGGIRATTLAAARRLHARDDAVVGRLERLFAVDRAPWTTAVF